MLDATLSALGLDADEFSWRDLSLCNGMDTNLFFDDYESDEQVAKITDELCLSCPIMKECLREGIENNETGVWGGTYLVNGKMDKNRNKHKTQEKWDEIANRVSNG